MTMRADWVGIKKDSKEEYTESIEQSQRNLKYLKTCHPLRTQRVPAYNTLTYINGNWPLKDLSNG